MRQRNTYSRIIQGLPPWENTGWGEKIRLLQHSVEKDITSFMALGPHGETLKNNSLGTALSESGLSRDEIQLLGGTSNLPKNPDDLLAQVEETLLHLKTDYLDLFFLDLRSPAEVVMPAVDRLFSQGKIVEIGIYKHHSPTTSSPLQKNSIKASLTNWNFNPSTMNRFPLEEPSTNSPYEMLWVQLQETEKFQEALLPLSQKYQHSPKEILLAWLLQHPLHFHPVMTGNKIEDLNLVARAHHLKIIEEDWRKIPDILQKHNL